MAMEDIIREKLTAALAPVSLEVINESHLHAGHAGSPGTGDSHFKVVITAAAFDGQTRVARQRMVMGALKDELATTIHALSISANTP